MINNRQQQGGRRRGRGGQGGQGGQRPQGMGNSGGHARDNRQRGNAAQLLEKYKSMARDAQLAGDRVQTEYYLQFAEHYFRVLEESRSRFEDQQQSQQRRRPRDDDDFDGEGDDEETMNSDGADDGDDGDDGDDEDRSQRQEPPRQQQQQQRPRRDRADRSERPVQDDRPRREATNEGRGNRDDNGAERDERISLGVLPPAIGATVSGDDAGVTPRPRRRVRRPASDEDGDIAPAA